MHEGLGMGAAAGDERLGAPVTGCVTVSRAEASGIAQAREFIEALERVNLRIAAVIVNRVMAEMPDAAEILPARIPAALKKKLKRNLDDYGALKTREEGSLNALRDSIPKGAILMVAPDLGRGPLTIADLAEVGRSLRPR